VGNFQNMLKTSLEYKKKREDQTKEVSKARLYKNSKKKIQTTMIGALASVEKYFGFLWGKDSEEEEMTPEQEQLKMIYEEARSEILDKGNAQIRNLESEFSGYDIIWKKKTLVLPFKAKGDEE
jgi:hypothetical protein